MTEKKSKREIREEKQRQKQEEFADAFDKLEGTLGTSDNQEKQLIRDKLAKMNLELFVVPSDGDCMFSALANQLVEQKLNHLVKEDESYAHLPLSRQLRHVAANFMKENRNDFQPFALNPKTQETMNDQEFNDYLARIATTNEWGGNLELQAISSALNVSIEVVQSKLNNIIIGTNADNRLTITYHYYSYSQAKHYNSTRPRKASTNQSNDLTI